MARNPEIARQSQRAWRKRNWNRVRDCQRRRYYRMRARAFRMYGGECSCCGESIYEFLQFDHIDGGGAAHRKKARLYGERFISWLLQKRRSNIRLLCGSCHAAVSYYGYCPHQEPSRVLSLLNYRDPRGLSLPHPEVGTIGKLRKHSIPDLSTVVPHPTGVWRGKAIS